MELRRTELPTNSQRLGRLAPGTYSGEKPVNWPDGVKGANVPQTFEARWDSDDVLEAKYEN